MSLSGCSLQTLMLKLFTFTLISFQRPAQASYEAHKPKRPAPYLGSAKVTNHALELVRLFYHREMPGVFKDLEVSVGNVLHDFFCHGDVGDEVVSADYDQRRHGDAFQPWAQVHRR